MQGREGKRQRQHESKKYLVLSTTFHLVPACYNLIVGQIAHKEAGAVGFYSQRLQRLPSVQDVPPACRCVDSRSVSSLKQAKFMAIPQQVSDNLKREKRTHEAATLRQPCVSSSFCSMARARNASHSTQYSTVPWSTAPGPEGF